MTLPVSCFWNVTQLPEIICNLWPEAKADIIFARHLSYPFRNPSTQHVCQYNTVWYGNYFAPGAEDTDYKMSEHLFSCLLEKIGSGVLLIKSHFLPRPTWRYSGNLGIKGGEVLTIKKDPFLHVINLMSKPNIDIFSTCLFFSCLPHFVIRIQENKEKKP